MSGVWSTRREGDAWKWGLIGGLFWEGGPGWPKTSSRLPSTGPVLRPGDQECMQAWNFNEDSSPNCFDVILQIYLKSRDIHSNKALLASFWWCWKKIWICRTTLTRGGWYLIQKQVQWPLPAEGFPTNYYAILSWKKILDKALLLKRKKSLPTSSTPRIPGRFQGGQLHCLKHI